MGIIDKCGVRGDATLCVVIFLKIVMLLILKFLFKVFGRSEFVFSKHR